MRNVFIEGEFLEYLLIVEPAMVHVRSDHDSGESWVVDGRVWRIQSLIRLVRKALAVVFG